MYTFWHYMRNRWGRDAGLRLDHLLLSPQLAPRLLKAGVDRKIRGEEGASDHAPAWAQIAVAHAHFDPHALLQPVTALIGAAVVLAFVRNRWVHGAALVALIGLYLINSAGRPLAGA